MEQSSRGWKAISGPHATAHGARVSLDFALTWAWPRMRGLIAVDTDVPADAHSRAAADAASPDPEAAEPAAEPAEYAEYAETAGRLRAGRVNRLEFQEIVYRSARTRRLLRWGPGGPEGPRPFDANSQAPRAPPPLDEDGTIVPED
ncbi:DUF5954 family protein [Streptomyces sp. NPDC046876]|uniref:DUF5954 family protein n=1 Tax=Streptomyces sp. NPDC046876 TaxID=3155616 RepID=UPI0033F5C0F3